MTPPAAAAARSTHAPARRPAARPRPRPVPAPAPARRPGRPAARPAARPAVARGSQLTLLDRIIRGRLWIVLLAGALMGLVFLQVSLLKLNSGIGRAVQTSSTLERQNALLRGEIARLDAGERIQTAATGLGLVMPAPGDRNYLTVRPGDAARAARSITAPAPVVQQALEPGATGVAGAPAATAAPAVTPAAAPTQTAAAPAATAPDPAAQAAQAPEQTTAAPQTSTTTAPAGTAAPPGTPTTSAPAQQPTAGGVAADPTAG